MSHQEFQHKAHETNQLISKISSQKRETTLSDQKFNEIWSQAFNTKRQQRQMRIRYYAIAASLALIISLMGTGMYVHSNKYVEQQYETGTIALREVSYYLNIGFQKMQPVKEIKHFQKPIREISKTEMALENIQHINKIPIKTKN